MYDFIATAASCLLYCLKKKNQSCVVEDVVVQAVAGTTLTVSGEFASDPGALRMKSCVGKRRRSELKAT